jgi:hypothetical protein
MSFIVIAMFVMYILIHVSSAYSPANNQFTITNTPGIGSQFQAMLIGNLTSIEKLLTANKIHTHQIPEIEKMVTMLEEIKEMVSQRKGYGCPPLPHSTPFPPLTSPH